MARVPASGLSAEEIVALASAEIDRLLQQVDGLTVQIAETVCGGGDESQDVELYDGSLGVSREFVDRFERPVGQLKWREDLAQLFAGPGDSAGDVGGARWSSGALVAPDLFLTAGHSFDPGGTAWNYPRRRGRALEPPDIARCMEASFNFQVDGSSPAGRLRADERFPVVDLLEHRVGGLDFAVARLGRGTDGRLPGERFGWLRLAAADVTVPGTLLCIIQHPNGQPKKIEAGPLLDNRGGRITYDSLDTLGGSSGSPILRTPDGHVVGVHTNGGCTSFSGFNSGIAVGTIRQATGVLIGLPDPLDGGQPAVPAPVPAPVPVPTPAPIPVPAPVPVPVPASDLGLAARLARFQRVLDALEKALGSPKH